MHKHHVSFSKVGRPTLECSSVSVIYQTQENSWRGFILPYDITFEADSKETVKIVLKDMLASYEEGLKKYNQPSHLTEAALSAPEDIEKFDEIQNDLIPRLQKKEWRIKGTSYYAEAKVSA